MKPRQLAVDHFSAPDGRFIKANGRFIERRQPVDHFTPVDHFSAPDGRFIKPRQLVDHFIARRPLYLKETRAHPPYRAK